MLKRAQSQACLSYAERRQPGRKARLNKAQSQACLSYAERRQLGRKARLNKAQSQACLSYAERRQPGRKAGLLKRAQATWPQGRATPLSDFDESGAHKGRRFFRTRYGLNSTLLRRHISIGAALYTSQLNMSKNSVLSRRFELRTESTRQPTPTSEFRPPTSEFRPLSSDL